MPLLAAFVLPALVLGLLLGSFLNVCISRIPAGESIISPRSHCPACGHPIRPYDNIPLLSWIVLRARCRDCRQPIPWRYPLVEGATALWFLLVALRALPLFCAHPGFGVTLSGATLSLETVALATLGPLLLALAVIDWQHHLLPDLLTIPGILLGFVLTCAQAALLPTTAYDVHFDPRRNLRLRSPGSFVARGDVFLTGTERLVFGRVAAILAAALVLLLIRWIYRAVRGREGLGLGDVKLLAMIAAFLGLAPAVLALFVGVLLGTGYALVLLALGRADRLTRLPLGSFLCVGGLVSALFGTPVLAWYTSLL